MAVNFTAMYILSWTPYACVAMYSAFIAKNPVNFYTAILPGIFAKLTIVWCPILEMVFNISVRRNLFYRRETEWDPSSFVPSVPRNSRNSHMSFFTKRNSLKSDSSAFERMVIPTETQLN